MRIKLVDGYHTHDYLITMEQLREMRLSVSTNVPPEVYELMVPYPQARANRPGIEYLPYPITPRPTSREGEGR